MHVVQGEVSTKHVNCGNIIRQIISIDENEKIGNIDIYRFFCQIQYKFYAITCHWSVMPQLFISYLFTCKTSALETIYPFI